MRSPILLFLAIASVVVIAEDCTTKESFVHCLEPALSLKCSDKTENLGLDCGCQLTIIEYDCYEKYCPKEVNPAKEQKAQCDSSTSASNKSTSNTSTTKSKPASQSGASGSDESSSAVDSVGLSRVAVMAVIAVAVSSMLGVVWQL